MTFNLTLRALLPWAFVVVQFQRKVRSLGIVAPGIGGPGKGDPVPLEVTECGLNESFALINGLQAGA